MLLMSYNGEMVYKQQMSNFDIYFPKLDDHNEARWAYIDFQSCQQVIPHIK